MDIISDFCNPNLHLLIKRSDFSPGKAGAAEVANLFLKRSFTTQIPSTREKPADDTHVTHY